MRAANWKRGAFSTIVHRSGLVGLEPGIIGFAAAGALIQGFGMAPTFAAVGVILLLSIVLGIPRPMATPVAVSEP